MNKRLHSPPVSKEAALDAATGEFRRWLDTEWDKGRKATHDLQVSLDPPAGSVRLRFRPPWEPIGGQ
jgi:hypothetical protein